MFCLAFYVIKPFCWAIEFKNLVVFFSFHPCLQYKTRNPTSIWSIYICRWTCVFCYHYSLRRPPVVMNDDECSSSRCAAKAQRKYNSWVCNFKKLHKNCEVINKCELTIFCLACSMSMIKGINWINISFSTCTSAPSDCHVGSP